MSSDKLDSFPIHFTDKNYSAWEFQFQLFVKGKELWSHINGSDPTPKDGDTLSKWEIKDAQVMTWILSSVEPHLVLNLRPYKTATAMWNYLHKVYNQDNTGADYSDIVYANVPVVALSAVQAVHETSKRDHFLMKLHSDFEIARSNLMNRHPHGRNKGRDMHDVQYFSCKTFGHIALDCPKKICKYCKKQGHIISACPIQPERKQGTAYHASIGTSSSTALPAASSVVPIPAPTALTNPNTLTPEMVQ
ncbi:hypothetical protein I3760_14G060300 [Carya illinoinensis]|nr:hypothetical protein I3760_14G060300 [Carya illinoinensis]